MNERMEFCKKVSNCIELINYKYPSYKEEIIKSYTLEQLSEECRNFILSHQDEKENKKEIENYLKWRLK